MQEPQSWRELLGRIINDPREKQRIAKALGVRTITLSRWVSKESDPRSLNLRNLLSVLPQYREQFLALMRTEEGFEEFAERPESEMLQELPTSLYNQVFNIRANTAVNLRHWEISSLILQHALSQLDPDRLGMSIMIVCCMKPPRGETKVRSLRELIGRGTPPWDSDLENKTLFLGAESLSGYVVTTCNFAAVQNIDDERGPMPAHKVDFEKSAAIHPIMFASRIAGCLLVSSTQLNYFLSSSRLKLIKEYADILALAFDAKDFYDPQDIELRIMPPQNIQKRYFADYRNRVTRMLIRSTKDNPISGVEAEELVWQELEGELLHLASQQDV